MERHTERNDRIRELKEGYNPRVIFEIAANKEKYDDSQSLFRYYVQEHLRKTFKPVPFLYTKKEFDSWSKMIYEAALFASRMEHFINSGILSDGRDVGPFSTPSLWELLFQKGVQNMSDTAFLSGVGVIGPNDLVETMLNTIKYEETGSGKVELNHCNMYEDMLESIGFKMLPYNRLADDPRLLDTSFSDPAFQLAIGSLPYTFLPEIIGMTYMLEWTGSPEALRLRKLLDSRGINSLFYRIHVKADAIRGGHGEQIKNIVPMYLEQIRQSQGEEAMQVHWQRIFNGSNTWGWIINEYERDLERHIVQFEEKLGVA